MIYFDNSATTRPYQEVLDAFIKVNTDYYANPSSLHNFGGGAERLVSHARQQIAGILGCGPAEIIFTSGGTEGNNMAIKGTALARKSRGRHIVTTAAEHPSVTEACRQLEAQGFEVSYVPVDGQGLVTASAIEEAMRKDTILVSVIHVNNEVGTVQPVEEIGTMLKAYPDAVFHVDHVQGAGKLPLDLEKAGIDLCTFSGHKLHGLKGTGFLYMRNGLRNEPLLAGGGQESGRRSGTENTGGIVSLAKALRMEEENRREHIAGMRAVKEYLIRGLMKIEGISIHTPQKNSAPHIINFSAAGLKGEVIVHALEEEGIIVSTTSACSSKQHAASTTLSAMGVPDKDAIGAVRISLGYGNTMMEAEKMMAALRKILQRLNRVTRR